MEIMTIVCWYHSLVLEPVRFPSITKPEATVEPRSPNAREKMAVVGIPRSDP